MIERVVYIQYTNPVAYPPLINSARELANEGFEVIFLGLAPLRESQEQDPAAYPFKFHQLAQPQSRLLAKLHYLYYCFWVVTKCIRLKPVWIYGSDLWSSPILRICGKLIRCRLIYHEHDLPSQNEEASGALRFVLSQRTKLLSELWLCITPNRARAEPLIQLGLNPDRLISVWNCPSIAELPAPQVTRNDHQLIYQGSLNPQRLPATILEAMTMMPKVSLIIVGYETIGHKGYMRSFLDKASTLGLDNRVVFAGDKSRQETLRICAEASIGLALTPGSGSDMNLQTMAGASNKVFEYLGCGCPAVVTEKLEWQQTIVERELGVTCDPKDPESIAKAIQLLLGDSKKLSKMRRACTDIVHNQWHYNKAFAPVIERMLQATSETTA